MKTEFKPGDLFRTRIGPIIGWENWNSGPTYRWPKGTMGLVLEELNNITGTCLVLIGEVKVHLFIEKMEKIKT